MTDNERAMADKKRSLRAGEERGRSLVRSAETMPDEAIERRRALSPDDLAVAVLSGRRVLVFQRDRMGGGGGRHQGCRDAASDWLTVMTAMAAAFATACSSRMRIGPTAEDSNERLREVAELSAAFAPTKERHLETTAQGRAFIEATRAAWPCEAIDRLAAIWDGPVDLSGRGRGHGRRARHRGRAGACRLICMPWSRTGFRPACGSFRSGRPTASACWPRWSRVAQTAARALKTPLDDVGSSAFRCRSRQHAA